MQIGKLRNRIELQNFVSDANEYGEQELTWSTYGTVWASIKTLRSTEIERADKSITEKKVEIQIYYRVDIEVDHRVKNGDIYYDVNAMYDPDDRKQTLILECTKVNLD